jgi:nitrate/nitrite transport system permease protein
MATAQNTFKKINLPKISTQDIRDWLLSVIFPTLGLLVFLAFWHIGSQHINTSLGTFPGPKQVAAQWSNLVDEYRAENARAEKFYLRQAERNEKLLAHCCPVNFHNSII